MAAARWLQLEAQLSHFARAGRCHDISRRLLNAKVQPHRCISAFYLEREVACSQRARAREGGRLGSCLKERLGKGRPWKQWCGSSRGFRLSVELKGVPPIMIRMPALSPTMEQGTIVKWLAKEGDTVMAGDQLCDIETDKAVVPLDSDYDAVLARILVSEGVKDIKLGTLIALMVEEGEDPSQVEVPTESAPPPTMAEGTGGDEAQWEGGHAGVGSRSEGSSVEEKLPLASSSALPLSPAVRHLVDTNNVDTAQVPASGPKDRLLKGDVLKYLDDLKAGKVTPVAARPTAPVKPVDKPQRKPPTPVADERPHTDYPVDEERKSQAQRAIQSKTTMPYSYATIQCSVDQLLQIQESLQDQGRLAPTVNDFLVKAAAVTMERLPACNAVWSESEGGVQLLSSIDISVSTATEKGQRTPLLKDANRSTVHDISITLKEQCDGAHAGRLHHHDTPGGPGLTVSTLGVYGVREFWPIIDPPQAATLAIGALELSPDQQGGPSLCVTVSLSCDARVVDYESACRWLEQFRRIVESPSSQGLL